MSIFNDLPDIISLVDSTNDINYTPHTTNIVIDTTTTNTEEPPTKKRKIDEFHTKNINHYLETPLSGSLGTSTDFRPTLPDSFVPVDDITFLKNQIYLQNQQILLLQQRVFCLEREFSKNRNKHLDKKQNSRNKQNDNKLKKNKKSCIFWKNGYCKNGNTCSFKHDNSSTPFFEDKIGKNYQKRCPNNNRKKDIRKKNKRKRYFLRDRPISKDSTAKDNDLEDGEI